MCYKFFKPREMTGKVIQDLDEKIYTKKSVSL